MRDRGDAEQERGSDKPEWVNGGSATERMRKDKKAERGLQPLCNVQFKYGHYTFHA